MVPRAARKPVALLLMLFAGGLSYWLHAIGDSGPLVAWGHGDANRMAVDAWRLIPFHAVATVGLAVAAPKPIRAAAAVGALVLIGFLALWALVHTAASLSNFENGVEVWGVAAFAALFSIYVYATSVFAPELMSMALDENESRKATDRH